MDESLCVDELASWSTNSFTGIEEGFELTFPRLISGCC